MKNIFKFHYSFIIFILILLFSGYINYVYLFLIIMLFHELGHIIMIKIMGYKILNIKIYPLGGVISTNIDLNIKSLKLFLISISGILMQLSLFLIIPRNIANYEIFKTLNYALIIYNLIPIYPSDGYKILLSIMENFFSYSITIKISYLISIISLFFIFYFNKSIITFVMLYYINIIYILNYRYYLHKFLLERYLYKIKYSKKKYIKNLKHLYKCRNNYIMCDNIYIEEEELLKKIFASYH